MIKSFGYLALRYDFDYYFDTLCKNEKISYKELKNNIELFYDYDQDTINKLPDFCLQGDKVYYSAYYLEDNSLVCLNFVEPNEGFKDIYKNIINDLNLND